MIQRFLRIARKDLEREIEDMDKQRGPHAFCGPESSCDGLCMGIAYAGKDVREIDGILEILKGNLTPEEETKAAWSNLREIFKKHDSPLTISLYDGEHEIQVMPHVTDQDGYGIFICEGTKAVSGEVTVSIGTKEILRILPDLVKYAAVAMAQRLRRTDKKLHHFVEPKELDPEEHAPDCTGGHHCTRCGSFDGAMCICYAR